VTWSGRPRLPHSTAGAINLNPQVSGTERKSIPNLVRTEGERIGDLFLPGSMDRVVEGHDLAGGASDWDRVADGTARVLRADGTLKVYFRGAHDVTQQVTILPAAKNPGPSRRYDAGREARDQQQGREQLPRGAGAAPVTLPWRLDPFRPPRCGPMGTVPAVPRSGVSNVQNTSLVPASFRSRPGLACTTSLMQPPDRVILYCLPIRAPGAEASMKVTPTRSKTTCPAVGKIPAFHAHLHRITVEWVAAAVRWLCARRGLVLVGEGRGLHRDGGVLGRALQEQELEEAEIVASLLTPGGAVERPEPGVLPKAPPPVNQWNVRRLVRPELVPVVRPLHEGPLVNKRLTPGLVGSCRKPDNTLIGNHRPSKTSDQEVAGVWRGAAGCEPARAGTSDLIANCAGRRPWSMLSCRPWFAPQLGLVGEDSGSCGGRKKTSMS
jgi:hypothetical protein